MKYGSKSSPAAFAAKEGDESGSVGSQVKLKVRYESKAYEAAAQKWPQRINPGVSGVRVAANMSGRKARGKGRP